MKNFGEAERKILEFFPKGTEFEFMGKHYRVLLSGKPSCQKGEPKTDVYLLVRADNEQTEIKISYKKENADFLENKISAERAEQLLGVEWQQIIKQSTTSIKERFANRALIFQHAMKRTEKGSVTLGWKFELLNKMSGDLSGKMLLTDEQLRGVYSGSNLSADKRNAAVCGRIIENSGVANYLLMSEKLHSAQDVINQMIPVEDYVRQHPDIYFACKALNYRTLKGKWDGNRPLSVQVNWKIENNKLVSELVYDKPLLVKGNEMANRLIRFMQELNIKTTDDMNASNVEIDKMV